MPRSQKIKTTQGNTQKLFLRIISIGGLVLLFASLFLIQLTTTGTGPGYILSGSNSVLNPDGGDFMSSLPLDEAWTLTSNEFSQFEQLAGDGGGNLSWTRVETDYDEPTGLEDSGDTQAGGACGNSDITTDADGGDDYAYYTIIDPDNVVNGDEILAVAVRVSDQVVGGFAFSVLIDGDGDCVADTNSTCGNPCFEYEMVLLAPGPIELINIDGCAGSADCDAKHGTVANGGTAVICNPCNEGTLQVMAGSTACTKNNLTPVFWMGYIELSKMPLFDISADFRLVPTTTTSLNSVIYKGANMADVGGVGDPSDNMSCDCNTVCSGSSCSDCYQDCSFSCSATKSITLPVEWVSVEGFRTEAGVELNWITANEENHSYFEIERMDANEEFKSLGRLIGKGSSELNSSYVFQDPSPPLSKLIYRIKQVDFDGKAQYSQLIEISEEKEDLFISVAEQKAGNSLNVQISKVGESRNMRFRLITINGASIFEETRLVQTGKTEHSFSTANLSPGVYVLWVSDRQSGRNWRKKIQLK